MTDDRSLERAARSWLELGPTEAPDHAVDAALLRIQSTAQERDWRVQLPRRNQPMTMPFRLVAAAIAIAVVAVGGILILRPGSSGPAATPSAPPSIGPSPISTVSPSPSTVVRALDYSALPGRILMEHVGNAPDGSEFAGTDLHMDRARFWWMDPKSMTGKTASEFLPGQPATGKLAADVSPDQTKLVFRDANGNGEALWTANLDGSGLTKIATTCDTSKGACANWDPSFDPTGTKIVFVLVQADATVLVIKDLPTGKETRLRSTEATSSDNVPETPDWSPDGTKIAFSRLHWKSEGNPGSSAIFVVDIAADRTTTVPVPGLSFPGNPRWTPDGSRLLFVDGSRSMEAVPTDFPGRTSDIYTIAPDGTGLERLSYTSQVVVADYTPDGQHIFYFNNFFWMMNPDGSDPRPVNVGGDDLSEPEVGWGFVGHWINTP